MLHKDISDITLECLYSSWLQHVGHFGLVLWGWRDPLSMEQCFPSRTSSQTWFQFSGHLSETEAVDWPGFCVARTWPNFHGVSGRQCTAWRREKLFFRNDICSCFPDISLTDGLLKRWRLVHFMGSVIGTFWFTSLSSIYDSYCSSLSFSICHTVKICESD